MKKYLTSLGVLFLGVAIQAHANPDPEPSVACDASGNPPTGTPNIAYGEHTTGCTIDTGSPGDVDVFTFNGTVGDVVRVIFHTPSENLQLKGRVRLPLQTGDPSGGVWTDALSCDPGTITAPDGCSFQLFRGLPRSSVSTSTNTDDKFLIEVSAVTVPSSAQDYSIELEVISPGKNDVDRIDYSTDPVNGVTLSSAVDPLTDVDYFRFYGRPNTTITVSLDVNSGGTPTPGTYFTPLLEVLTPNVPLNPPALSPPSGQTVGTDACGTNSDPVEACPATVTVTPGTIVLPDGQNLGSLEGYYLIIVADQYVNDIGPYSVTVSCVNDTGSTNCSTTPASLDVTLDGVVDALTDGTVIMDYMLQNGSSAPLASTAAGEDTLTPADVLAATPLDVDGNGFVGVDTDGLLIMRYMFGLRGQALVGSGAQSAVADGCVRCSPESIEAFLAAIAI